MKQRPNYRVPNGRKHHLHTTRTKTKNIMPLSFQTYRMPLLASVLATSLVAGCSNEAETVELNEPVVRPVKVLEVALNSQAPERVLAATVISANSQNLSFRVGGSITELPATVGSVLAAGDLVARLDSQPFLLNEKEASAQVAQSRANYNNAQSQYERVRELYSTEAASLSELENTKAAAASAQATLTLAREGLNAAQLNLGYSELRNPSDNCQVVSVPVSVNQNISAGQTIITTACGDQLRLQSSVPEGLITTVNVGTAVTGSLQSNGASLSGTVVEVAVSNTDGSGYQVEVELDNPPESVRVGMAAEVTFRQLDVESRLIVPLVAVLSDSNGKFVYVAEASDPHFTVAKQAVSTGALSNEGIEITDGLAPGTQVIVAGMSRISEGMTVSLYDGAGSGE